MNLSFLASSFSSLFCRASPCPVAVASAAASRLMSPLRRSLATAAADTGSGSGLDSVGDSLPEIDPPLTKRRTVFLGGDHNEVTLLGTLLGIRHKEMSKGSGTQPYSVMHILTHFNYRDVASGKLRGVRSVHQVIAFTVSTNRTAKQCSVGDRVFVAGRLNYFQSKLTRVASIHATRIVPMAAKSLGDGVEDEADQPYGDEDDVSL